MVGKKALLLSALTLLFLAACTAPSHQEKRAAFTPPPRRDVIYVVPFTTIMVPPQVAADIFDRFIDALNDGGEKRQDSFVVLKGGAGSVSPAWLRQQNYVTGQIFGYVEESGCCSTDIRVKSRLQLHQPGSAPPTLVLDYPRDDFFDKDYSTLTKERRKLAANIAGTLASRLLAAIGAR